MKSVAKKGEIGILQIDFPQPSDDDDRADANLEQISRDEFLREIRRGEAGVLYQENSNFNKLVSRENVETDGGKKR